jgi:hypothetical protein
VNSSRHYDRSSHRSYVLFSLTNLHNLLSLCVAQNVLVIPVLHLTLVLTVWLYHCSCTSRTSLKLTLVYQFYAYKFQLVFLN